MISLRRTRGFSGSWTFLFVTLLLLTVSCASEKELTVRGDVSGLQAPSLIEWDLLTITTDIGKQYVFSRGKSVDLRFWRASHLRAHMQDKLPVTVNYLKGPDGLVAIGITD